MWVKLSKRHGNGSTEPIYVNMDQVTHYIEHQEGLYTTLYLNGENTKLIQVLEKAAAIASLCSTSYP
jgi:hypothetical protein